MKVIPFAEFDYNMMQSPTALEAEIRSDTVYIYEIGDELPKPSPEQQLFHMAQAVTDEMAAQVQRHLDAFAFECGYDNILSACSYANDPNPTFALEGKKALEARSSTWSKANEIQNDILMEFQKALEEGRGDNFKFPEWSTVQAQLPKLVWPEGSRGYKKEA